jgi:limonene-1,2-epoxide hydrolase
MVVNERFDLFTLPTREIKWNGVGVFFLKDGKIAEWSDYTVRMG